MSAPMKLKLQHVTMRRNGDGSLRYYFRRRGLPLERLPDDPLSPEFMREYRRSMDSASRIRNAGVGSLSWICDEYLATADFKGKAKATQAARKRIIIQMCREPLDPDAPELFGHEQARHIGRRHIEVLRDRKADNPFAANERLKILSQIFKMGVSRGFVDHNPVRDAERLRTRPGGHKTATDAQIAQYLAYHTSGPARLCMMILKNTGVRVSDLRLLGRQHMKGGLLTFATVKTGVLCELPVTGELSSALAECTDMTFLLSDDRVPFASDKALSQRISKWFRQAGVAGVTAHSVRKWLATQMAENGATEYELMAWFGWRDPKEARPYVQAANRQKLAGDAVHRIGKVERVTQPRNRKAKK